MKSTTDEISTNGHNKDSGPGLDRVDFSVFAEGVPSAIGYADSDQRILFHNNVFGAWWGGSLDDNYRKRLQDALGEDYGSFEPIVKRALSGERGRAEIGIRSKDGKGRTLDVTYVPDKTADGIIKGFFIRADDITERKQAEQELDQTQDNLKDYLETSSIGLHWVGPDGTILWANKADYAYLGYKREEFVGHNIVEFHADRPVIDDILTRLKRDERLKDYEARLRCKDGSIRYVLINSSVLWNDGEFVHTRCFTLDITDRKTAEKELQESRRLMERIADTVPEVIYVYDVREQRNTYINREMTDVLGYTPAEVMQLGSHVMERLLHPEDLPKIIEDYKGFASLADGAIVDREYRIRHSNGSYRWMANRTVVFSRDADGTVKEILGVGQDVTEAKLARESLLRSESQLRTILDTAPMGIYVVDHELRIRHVNPAALPTFGPNDGLLGRDLHEVARIIFPKPTADEIIGRFRHTLLTGEPYVAKEFSEVREDRKTREYFDWQIQRVCFADGRFGVVCYFTDISAHVLERQAVVESENRLRTLLSNIPDVIARFDRDIRFLYISPAVERLTGWKPEHFIGKTHAEAGIPLDLSKDLEAALIKIFETGQELNIRFYFPGVQGVRHLIGFGIPEKDPTGKVASVLTIVRDMTEQLLYEEAALQRAAVVDSSADAIITKTLDGMITSWNMSAERIFGYAAEEIIGKHVTILFPPDHIDEETHIIGRIKNGERVDHYETIRRKKDGSLIPISLTVSPIRDSSGKIIGASKIARDISAQKQYEQKLMDQAKELEQFAYVSSHDLQEPLRKVATYAQMLSMTLGDQAKEDVKKYIENICQGAARMQNLIRDLLEYSRLDRQERPMENVDLAKVMESVTNDLENSIKESGAEIRIETLPEIMGISSQLHQVMQNLVGNALKYRAERTPKIRVFSEERESDWVMGVQDNGIGIDPKYWEQIFKVFQRLHSKGKYQGTGIGLAICKKIVEQHGGRIWVDSTVGQGSTFFFSLPKKIEAMTKAHAS